MWSFVRQSSSRTVLLRVVGFIVLSSLRESRSWQVTRIWPAGVSCHHPDHSHPGAKGEGG